MGHYLNQCKAKQRIQALTIDERLKRYLINLFINETDSEEEDYEVNVVDYTLEEDFLYLFLPPDKKSNYDYYKSLCAMNRLLVLTK